MSIAEDSFVPVGEIADLSTDEQYDASDDGVSLSSGDEDSDCIPHYLRRAALPCCMVAQDDTSRTYLIDTAQPDPTLEHALIRTCRSVAESRAHLVLQRRQQDGTSITHADLWSVLSLWRCSRNTGRKRIWPTGASSVPSDTFGLVRRIDIPAHSPEAWYMAQKTASFPIFCQLVNLFLLQQLTDEQRRWFRFPSLALIIGFCKFTAS